jgi:mannose-1-phosphate guanylyltransferase
MKAVILVGGQGTRLRPLTLNIGKAMVPVLNKPFLEHMLYYLRAHVVDDIVLAMHYRPSQVEDYFGAGGGLGIKLSYVVEENPLGTAGAVKNSEQYLGETFFVLNGDVFTDLDLGAMMAFHGEKEAKGTIALTPVADPTLYGVVETDERGRIQRFVEKPAPGQGRSNMINAGIYVLEPEVLRYIPPQTHFMFEYDLFPMLLEMGQPLYGYATRDYWIDIGNPEKYLRLNHDLLLGRCGRGFSCIAEASSIHPTARIREPVVIGRDANIGPDVLLQGPTVIGPGCKIGEQAVVEGSVLWSKVQVGRRAMLQNCIIADNCSIGDEAYVGSGSVLGADVTVARGGRLEPGTKVWPGTEVESQILDQRG